MRDSERIDGQLYQVKEQFEDQRDLMLDDTAYFRDQRDHKQRRRDQRKEKRRAQAPMRKQDYLEDDTYNEANTDLYSLAHLADPISRHHGHSNKPQPGEDEEAYQARKAAKKEKKRKAKAELAAQKAEEEKVKAEAEEERRRQEDAIKE